MGRAKRQRWLAVIGPGILVAATGVGAGDLATGALAGSRLGVTVLWAVIVGAVMKFLVTEGLTRWQLATGETVLEGAAVRFGRTFQYLFLAYLAFWTFFVSSALMSAAGVAAHALLPMLDARSDKILYGLLHSAVAVVLVQRGGYRLFEKVMSVCIGMMFVTVVSTAIASRPDWPAVLQGLLNPAGTDFTGEGLQWTVAVMGGVGGTVTVLCYGYWIREEGRYTGEALRSCRIDLATGYIVTAVFGMAMVILGSPLSLEKEKSATLLVQLADQLQTTLAGLGAIGRWAFLIGGWGAIASSLLGVWQSVPYLFADLWSLISQDDGGFLAGGESTGSGGRRLGSSSSAERIAPLQSRSPIDTRSLPYRGYLYVLATVPAFGLWFTFENVQKAYAIVGAAFIPLLAFGLLILNGRARWVGREYRNSWGVALLLALVCVFFAVTVWLEAVEQLSQ